MRVAIEAATLALTSGGLARYTSELSLALGRCFPDDEFYLISDQPFQMPPGAPPPAIGYGASGQRRRAAGRGPKAGRDACVTSFSKAPPGLFVDFARPLSRALPRKLRRARQGLLA